jgi:hypothetical protein
MISDSVGSGGIEGHEDNVPTMRAGPMRREPYSNYQHDKATTCQCRQPHFQSTTTRSRDIGSQYETHRRQQFNNLEESKSGGSRRLSQAADENVCESQQEAIIKSIISQHSRAQRRAWDAPDIGTKQPKSSEKIAYKTLGRIDAQPLTTRDSRCTFKS